MPLGSIMKKRRDTSDQRKSDSMKGSKINRERKKRKDSVEEREPDQSGKKPKRKLKNIFRSNKKSTS